MHTTKITTRTLPATETLPKRVRVRSESGMEADYPWDHSHDAPEVHYHAACKLATMENQGEQVTAFRIPEQDHAMGYVFSVVIGRVAQ